MVKEKFYLDGCSYTFGLGLEPEHTLAHLFHHEATYHVTNNSRNGKSNLAIAMDTYAAADTHDIFVLGFTYSGRFYLKTHDQKIDFQPVFWEPYYGNNLNSAAFEQAYTDFHKNFYSLYNSPFCDEFSDLLLDTLYAYLLSLGKKVVMYSWEKRDVKAPVLYPYIPVKYLLPNNHYNPEGTKMLFNMLQTQIGALNQQ